MDNDTFQRRVSHFKTITLHFTSLPFQSFMDPAVKQLIASAVNSAVIAAVATMQAKQEDEMMSLCDLIEKTLIPNALPSSPTPPADPDTSPKPSLLNSSLRGKRWNQAELGYFDPHLDRAYGEGKVISVGKKVYYRKVVLFVQRVQSLATFRRALLVKTNIATSLHGSALEWYTSELRNFNHDTLNNDSGVKS